MTQGEINKISGKELQQILQRHPDRQAVRRACLESLGEEAKAWWAYRQQSKFEHIVDWNTGEWASQFPANGHTYYIRSLEQGIGMRRYTELKKGLAIVGFDSTFGQIAQNVKRIQECVNSLVTKQPRLTELVEVVANLYEGIKRSDRNTDYAFLVATLFIVRADEDMNTWDEALAQEKIEDWQAAEIHELDFFFLALYWASALSEWLEALQPKVTARLQKAGFLDT